MNKREAKKKQKRLLKRKERAYKEVARLDGLQKRLAQAETPEEILAIEKEMGPDHELKFKFNDDKLKALREAGYEIRTTAAEVERLQSDLTAKTVELKKLQGIATKIQTTLSETWRRLGGVTTPQTLGEYLQGLIIFTELLETRPQVNGIETDDWDDVVGSMSEFRNYGLKTNRHLKKYGPLWKKDGYARVAVGHKLASALMLTSVPDDIEVRAPWETWILEIPDGLYPLPLSPSAFHEALDQWDRSQRVADINVDTSTRGDEVHGEVRALLCTGALATHMIFEINEAFVCLKLAEGNKVEHSNYVKGVCIAFHDRKHVQEGRWGKTSKGSGRSGPPGLGCHYVLSKPVSVDFRNEVREILRGSKKHKTLTAQFLVRGHWRNQVCGKGLLERKHIWIEPFWKGPEDSRVLLRGYNLKGS